MNIQVPRYLLEWPMRAESPLTPLTALWLIIQISIYTASVYSINTLMPSYLISSSVYLFTLV
jgi:hypothetical protein